MAAPEAARAWRPAAAAWLLALLLGSGCAPAWPGGLQPGEYEGLMLAVDPAGLVTGVFDQSVGRGPSHRCRFFLQGHVAGDAARIVAWRTARVDGKLSADADGVTLQIPSFPDPGCDQVLPAPDAQGLVLDRTRRAAWTELQRVQVERSHLHDKPQDGSARRAYLVRDDVVAVIARQPGWVRVEYRGKGNPVLAWLPEADMAPLAPPAAR